MTAYEEFREGDPVNPFDYLVAEAKVAHLEGRLRRCQGELELLTEERDAALLALDEARAQHELHHGGPR